MQRQQDQELPEELWQLLNGFRESRAILTAIELDLFSAVGQGSTPQEVAKRLATDPRATDFLLHALASLKLLDKRQGVFYNTPESARFFVADSPENSRAALLHTVNLWDRWSGLTECVQTGHPKTWPARDAAQTSSFIAAMHRGASMRAPLLIEKIDGAPVRRMLDIGGGSGAYAIAFAQANPELQAEVFDLASVVPIAERHIAAAGLSARVKTRVGNMLKDNFGKNYDLLLLSSICHMLGPEENLDLFKRAQAALAPQGRLVVQDFILDADRTTPRQAALFALNMLVNTPAGGTYSNDEFHGWMKQAGFAKVESFSLPCPTNLVVGTK